MEVDRETAIKLTSDPGALQDFIEREKRFAQSLAYIKQEQIEWKKQWKIDHPRKPRKKKNP